MEKEFRIGDTVSYGLHGKCQVIGIEEVSLGGDSQTFYNLETTKVVGAKHHGVGLKVLVPTEKAIAMGVRDPLTEENEVDTVLSALAEDELKIPIEEHWKLKQKKLDDVIRIEGASGLAKALGHLVQIQENRKTLSSDESKYFKLIKRILSREIAEVFGFKSNKEADKKIDSAIRKRIEEIEAQMHG